MNTLLGDIARHLIEVLRLDRGTTKALFHRMTGVFFGRRCLIGALLNLAFGLSLSAQVPGVISHQGRLMVQGTNFSGSARFKFSLVSTNGSGVTQTLWSHDGTGATGSEPTGAAVVLPVTRGVFSVNLGDASVPNMTAAIPATTFTNAEVWLRIWVDDGVNGSQQLAPDRRLTAVGYAFAAGALIGVAPAATNFTGSLAGDVSGAQSATVVNSVGGLSAANVSAGAALANAAASANTPDSLVRRDASGNFSAGTVSGVFVGDGQALTNLSATNLVGVAPAATNFTGLLAGDVSGAQSTTVVNSVGGLSASNLAAGASLANGASVSNVPNALVRRDTNGNFSAGTITGAFVGDAQGLTNFPASQLNGVAAAATNFTGFLFGDVSGPQTITVVNSVGGVAASNVASGATLANAATSTNTPSALVRRDANGDFAAGVVSGTFVGNGQALTNLTATNLVGVAPASTNFTGQLFGDVIGNQSATVVKTVAGLGATNVASGAALANASASSNVLGAIVRREDCYGDFDAGTVRAVKFVGDGSGLTNLSTSPSSFQAPSGSLLVSILSADASLISAGYRLMMTLPAPGWVNGSSTNAPSARSSHSTVWTGTEMLVWGGLGSSGLPVNSGGSYSAVTDVWTPMTTVGAPAARSVYSTVWSGTELLVWGGLGASGNLGTGGRYSPSSLNWSTISTVGAPEARQKHVAVWTGSKMLVWGGLNIAGLLNDGALYDPVADTWTALPTADAPEGRMSAVGVWANDRFIVWGGQGETGDLASGGQLIFTNGVPSHWVAMNTTNAPDARSGHSAVWIGDKMFVWGGKNGGVVFGDGAAFCAHCDTWFPISSTNAPSPRYDASMIATTTGFVVFGGANNGGELANGSTYDPTAGEWLPLSTLGSPSARAGGGGVWTGTEMILFGGRSGGSAIASPQRLVPQPTWYFYRKL